MGCNRATDYGYLYFGSAKELTMSGQVSAHPAAFQEDGSFWLLNARQAEKRQVLVYRLFGETISPEKDGEIQMRVSLATTWPCKWA